MGFVRVTARIESEAGRQADREFLVDTGSFYSAISPDLRGELALPRGFPARIMLADGSVVDSEVVLTRIRLLDREGVVPVEVVNVPEPLIGVSALEALGLKVNPVTRELEHDRPYGPPPSFRRVTAGHDRRSRLRYARLR
jgi:predicted aspartyl protease